MHGCFTSCIFAARTPDFAVKLWLVFSYEAVVFRRYVLALLLVGLLRKFEAYVVYLSLNWAKNPRRFSFFQQFRHFTYVAMVSLCHPQFSRANWWHEQSFFSSVCSSSSEDDEYSDPSEVAAIAGARLSTPEKASISRKRIRFLRFVERDSVLQYWWVSMI